MHEQPNLVERVEVLEQQVQQLMAAVFTPIAITPVSVEPNMADATREVMHTLGGEPLEEQPKQTPTPRRAPELEGQVSVEEVIEGEIHEPVTHHPDHRAVASRRAETIGAVVLTRNFRPSLVGYTATMFREDYPDLDPGTVVEQFFNHHLSKGTKSKNWLEEFFKFAGRAQQWAEADNKITDGETDSMGLPINGAARRGMLGHNQREEPNATHDN